MYGVFEKSSPDNEEKETEIFVLKSTHLPIKPFTKLKKIWAAVINEFDDRIENLLMKGSGYILTEVLKIHVEIAEKRALRSMADMQNGGAKRSACAGLPKGDCEKHPACKMTKGSAKRKSHCRVSTSLQSKAKRKPKRRANRKAKRNAKRKAKKKEKEREKEKQKEKQKEKEKV